MSPLLGVDRKQLSLQATILTENFLYPRVLLFLGTSREGKGNATPWENPEGTR
jgi:hypothetical protein